MSICYGLKVAQHSINIACSFIEGEGNISKHKQSVQLFLFNRG